MVIGISLSVSQGNPKDIFVIKSDLRWDEVELTYNNLSKLEVSVANKVLSKLAGHSFNRN